MITAAHIAATTAPGAQAPSLNGPGQGDQVHDSFLDSMIAAVAASSRSVENGEARAKSNELMPSESKARSERAKMTPPNAEEMNGDEQNQGNVATATRNASQNNPPGSQTKADVASGALGRLPEFIASHSNPAPSAIAQASLEPANMAALSAAGVTGEEQKPGKAATTARKASQSPQSDSKVKADVASSGPAQLTKLAASYFAPAQAELAPETSVATGKSMGSTDSGPLGAAANVCANVQPALSEPDPAVDQAACRNAAVSSDAKSSVTAAGGTQNSEVAAKTAADTQAETDSQSNDSTSTTPVSASVTEIAAGNNSVSNAAAAVRAAAELSIRGALESLASDRTPAKSSGASSQPATEKNTPGQVATGQTAQAQNSQSAVSHPAPIASANGLVNLAANANAAMPSHSLIASAAPLEAKGASTLNADDDSNKGNSPESASLSKQHGDATTSNTPDNAGSAVQGSGSVNTQPVGAVTGAQGAVVSAVSASLHSAQDSSVRPHGASDSPVSDPQGSSGTSSRLSQSQDGGLGNAELNPAVAAVNAARLIQRVGNTEIRVGMHSPDFGNVSISTITTRGALSAEISLDHAELAKTIAAHLPETEARLGANQPVEVRVSASQHVASGAGTGQGGARHDTSGRGSGNSRQPAQDYLRGSTIREPEAVFANTAAAAPENYAISSRLDIRV